MNYLIVFLAIVAVDIAWTMYISETSAGRAFQGAAWSAGITALSGVVTLVYVEDKKTIFAAVAGAFVGTYLTLKWKARKK